MDTGTWFRTLNSVGLVDVITSAQQSVVYAAPGVQPEVADAMIQVANRIGPEMITVSLDFDERVMRMGYGDIGAVDSLRKAGIRVRTTPDLRTGLVIADKSGFVFSPTPFYLEAEPTGYNAIRMSAEQVTEALARLSPVAKIIAIAQANAPEEKKRIEALPVDISSSEVSENQFTKVENNLKEAPPVRFDLARQVRVFESYLQYVELSLSGAAIQRHRLAIPPSIQQLGGGKEIEGRLRTTFDLIEKNSKLSLKPLEDALNEIRKNFTPSLGKDHGRVVLKKQKPHLIERLKDFRKKLDEYQSKVKSDLQSQLNTSLNQIIDYYMPIVEKKPPDVLLGQLISHPTADEIHRWLEQELQRVFPKADALINEMKLEERYKDVTFETLNRDDFIDSLKQAFPLIDWDKAYKEFKAAAETGQ